MKRKVVITGAANGIGAAAARLFLERGWVVLALDVAADSLGRISQDWKERGCSDFEVHSVDISDHARVEALFDEIFAAHGEIHALVNNAGIVRDAMLVKMEEKQFDDVIAVNLKGVFNCGQAVARRMKQSGGGAIVNVSSICGLYGNIGQTNYTASKWGVIGMTKTWAKELGRFGIRCNAIAPGFIETQMVGSIPQPVRDQMLKQVALARSGRPEEVAEVIYFLASENSSFVTGAVVEVSGGMSI